VTPAPATISDELWATFPAAARAIVVSLLEPNATLEARVVQLEAQVADLTAKLNRNSSNSSLPPSANPLHAKPAPPKPKSGKRRGGQIGHPKNERVLLPPDEIIAIKPEVCRECRHPLAGEDPVPIVLQVQEIPEIKPKVSEYRRHRLKCQRCGTITCGVRPAGIQSGYGPRAEATIADFGGQLRVSKQATSDALGDLFGLPIGPAAVCKLQAKTAAALEPIAIEILEYVRDQPAANIDETSWNKSKPKSWLWCLVAPLATAFLIRPQRNREAFDDLVGSHPPILTSDRFKVYDHLPPAKRQVCWAHLRRDFQAMIDRNNAGTKVGVELLSHANMLFEAWPKVRDGTLTRDEFRQQYLPDLPSEVGSWLRDGTATACAKTTATCREILKVEESLWTFALVEGVEPTNNAAERSLRHAVCWRKVSYGTKSESGRRFAERILTAVATCRQQGRGILAFLYDAIHSARTGQAAPSLLPGGV